MNTQQLELFKTCSYGILDGGNGKGGQFDYQLGPGMGATPPPPPPPKIPCLGEFGPGMGYPPTSQLRPGMGAPPIRPPIPPTSSREPGFSGYH